MKTKSQRPNYLKIISHYEDCLERYGDSHLGVDWPNLADAETRYQVMLEVIRSPLTSNISILDFGCGASHMYEYIQKKNLQHIDYSGLDISEKFIELSKKKFPYIPYYCLDILQDHAELPVFDFVIMNGVFTEKRELAFDEMYEYFKKMICGLSNTPALELRSMSCPLTLTGNEMICSIFRWIHWQLF